MSTTDNLAVRDYPMAVDANGFLMPSFVHAPATASDRNIFFLGGSTTQCLYNSGEKRFPYLVGRLLEGATRFRINTYNCGVSGNTSMHSNAALMSKILGLKPYLVVMMHNINDLNVLVYDGTYFNNHPRRSLIVDVYRQGRLRALRDAVFPNLWFWYGPAVMTLMKGFTTDEWSHARGKPIIIQEERWRHDFARSLRLFVNICRAGDIIPVLMTQPNRFVKDPDPFVLRWVNQKLGGGISYEEFRLLYSSFNGLIETVGRECDVKVIGLADEIPQTKHYIYDPVHLTEQGSELAAQIIARSLADTANSIDSGSLRK